MAKYYGDKKKSAKGMGKPPSELVMKDYPKSSYGGPMGVRDDREGIDMLAKSNHNKMIKNPGGRY